jgi:hypothetical protein
MSAPNIFYLSLNINSTLNDIYACMQRESQAKWGNRFLRKATIEDALLEFNMQLDDATTSFQAK